MTRVTFILVVTLCCTISFGYATNLDISYLKSHTKSTNHLDLNSNISTFLGYTCPDDIVLDVAPGDCNSPITWSFQIPDGCPTNISQIDNTGYQNGDYFPNGTTMLIFEVEENGIIEYCIFTVTVNGAPDADPGIICRQQVNVGMPYSCEYILAPEVFLNNSLTCPDAYIIIVDGEEVEVLDQSYVGQNLPYQIVHSYTGNYCDGMILIEDNTAPNAGVSCSDYLASCFENTAPTSEGGDVPTPEFEDCSDFSYDYYDEITQGGCNVDYTTIITRQWLAVDDLGHQGTCTQVIEVERLILSDYNPQCPPNYEIQCQENTNNYNFSPQETGYPTFELNGTIIELKNGVVCSWIVDYEDEDLTACNGMKKIRRTWSILDWCATGIPPVTCIQELTVIDNTGPVITTPEDIVVSAEIGSCVTTLSIPSATATDCSDQITWSTQHPFGVHSGNGVPILSPGLSVGTHTITYMATDACGNSSSASIQVMVVDEQIPSAVCDGSLSVTLGDDGSVLLTAGGFDAGSNDNCCVDQLAIARLDDNCGNTSDLNFGASVSFCCQDVGIDPWVVLQVTDCHGNTNICMSQITVLDNTIPNITCPSDITISCGQDIEDLTITGQPTVIENCTPIDISYQDTGGMNCNGGSIIRTWIAAGSNGQAYTCQQTISIVNDSPLSQGYIICPAEFTTDECNINLTPDNTGSPIVNAPPCTEVNITYSDEVLDYSGTFCSKIFRTWVITDLCLYDGNPANGGYFECMQAITVNNNIPPTLTCNTDSFCSTDDNCTGGVVNLPISAIDDCTPTEDIQFNWVVDLFNDGNTDTGALASGVGINQGLTYPIGTHFITYSAKDDCGNLSTCAFTFDVNDCVAPVVTCQGSIGIPLQSDGFLMLTTQEIGLMGTTDQCTDDASIRVSYSIDPDDNSRTFSCNDLQTNTLRLYFTDLYDNQSSCEFAVQIMDPYAICPSQPLIASGALHTQFGVPLNNTQVDFDFIDSTSIVWTTTDGNFQQVVPYNQDTTFLTPVSNNDLLNGVSTWDIVLIRRHILNIAPFDSPYQYFAGDINNNGSVTTADIVALRAALLQYTDAFPNNNTAWKFVNANFQFDPQTNALQQDAPQSIMINNMNEDSPDNNFIAIKVGDLNGNANTGFDTDSDVRNSDTKLTIQNNKINSGQFFDFNVAYNEAQLQAFQATLIFDPQLATFIDVNHKSQTQNIHINTSEAHLGIIIIAWVSKSNTMEYTPLISFQFEAHQETTIKDIFTLSNQKIPSKAYNQQGIETNISLDFKQQNDFNQLHNYPNPFSTNTQIEYTLNSEDQNVTITAYDIHGHTVPLTLPQKKIGTNTLTLYASQLPHKGVWYYQLKTDKHIITKKMVVQ